MKAKSNNTILRVRFESPRRSLTIDQWPNGNNPYENIATSEVLHLESDFIEIEPPFRKMIEPTEVLIVYLMGWLYFSTMQFVCNVIWLRRFQLAEWAAIGSNLFISSQKSLRVIGWQKTISERDLEISAVI